MTYRPQGPPGPYGPQGPPNPYTPAQPAAYPAQPSQPALQPVPQAPVAQVQCQFCAVQNIAGTSKCTNCGGPLPASPQPGRTASRAAPNQALRHPRPKPRAPGKRTATTAAVLAILGSVLVYLDIAHGIHGPVPLLIIIATLVGVALLLLKYRIGAVVLILATASAAISCTVYLIGEFQFVQHPEPGGFDVIGSFITDKVLGAAAGVVLLLTATFIGLSKSANRWTQSRTASRT